MNGELVFVYGTLRRGASHHFRMQCAEFVRAGSVRGQLFRVTWYPALLCGGTDLVKGELYRVSSSSFAELDEFEGCEYRRIKTEVLLEDGASEQAWVWEWLGNTNKLVRVLSGDWLQEERSSL
jgi:gamma-glutamylcyclotransferase (GGCT)/AIG2-like uncharacterized protein YtfP